MKYIFVSMSFMMGFLWIGCGRSPMLHHEDEGIHSQQAASSATSQSSCSLRWVVGGQELCGGVQWVVGPRVGENKFNLVFSRDVTALTITAEPWMPSMGHGTAPVNLRQINTVTLEVSEVFFIMAGRWVVHVRVAEGVGVAQDQTFEIEL